MHKLFGLKFRNSKLAFNILKDLGYATKDFLYVGSTKRSDFFQELATHEIVRVCQKGRTGTSALLAYGRKARIR